MDVDLRLVRRSLTPAERTQHYAALGRGDLTRVMRGVGIEAHEWDRLDRSAQFIARIKALALTTRQRVVFSHAAAAALWELPWLGSWPTRIDTTAVRTPGRSTTVMRLHSGPLREYDEVDGLPVTSLARTVVDVARDRSLEIGVMVADAVLAGWTASGERRRAIDTASIQRELDLVPLRSGGRKARRVLNYSDPLAESPGESLSRVTLLRAGVARPVLQKRFELADGRAAFADFWWPDAGVVGEFDGKGKYLRDPSGRDPGEVVLREKLREDALRALGVGVFRWDWTEAASPDALRRKLRRAGVPMRPNAVSSTVCWYEPAQR